ncbi:MAG: cysteine--1-D-myo-inosityl 2-amino-2-deoxy-alpha-D-glucopyranoside ligase [Nocardioides sp.]|uniref:cysteine--1-D-myo-inosityl 2-amino-2-deoxy-alpha-D-glucopyranoside ligase n=1 Tax=Nocardioides sp. TaxID=35761 RepID=UPI003267DEB7
MRSWSSPEVPDLTLTGPAVRIHDTSSGGLVETRPEGPARLYVCGITPYDATHMGHAATYLAFDLLNRAWRSAGHDVTYVQNVTDVDDPLLERALKVKVDWVALAERETELFRHDMEALRVLAPDHYIGAVESIPLVIDLITRLQEAGAIYEVESDLYFSVTADAAFGDVSGWSRDEMLRIFGERGGDPDREGKRDPLDCVVWRGKREGEPSWDSPFGPGRPGWHIECTAIALEHLGTAFDVQGGGSDLIFPHHEMCAGEAQVADPGQPFAKAYSHAGMVAYDGEKMSKSKGNLVFVSALRNSDVDPMAIRLVLLRHHYRSDWEWTDDQLWDAVDTVAQWRKALVLGAGAPAAPVVAAVLAALANDLDAPTAVAAIDDWVASTLGDTAHGLADTSDPDAAATLKPVLDAALGLLL